MISTSDPFALHVVRPVAARMGWGPATALTLGRASVMLTITQTALTSAGFSLVRTPFEVGTLAVGVVLVSLVYQGYVEIAVRWGEGFVQRTILSHLALRVGTWIGATIACLNVVGALGLRGLPGFWPRIILAGHATAFAASASMVATLYLLLCDRPPPRRRADRKRRAYA